MGNNSSMNLNSETNTSSNGISIGVIDASQIHPSHHQNAVQNEENLIYSSIDSPDFYRVKLVDTPASLRCGLKSVAEERLSTQHNLILTSISISLAQDGKIIFIWPYRHIRRYGCTKDGFSLEAGRKCASGEGLFSFITKDGNLIFQSVASHVNSLKVSRTLTDEQLNAINGNSQVRENNSMTRTSCGNQSSAPGNGATLSHSQLNLNTNNEIKKMSSTSTCVLINNGGNKVANNVGNNIGNNVGNVGNNGGNNGGNNVANLSANNKENYNLNTNHPSNPSNPNIPNIPNKQNHLFLSSSSSCSSNTSPSPTSLPSPANKPSEYNFGSSNLDTQNAHHSSQNKSFPESGKRHSVRPFPSPQMVKKETLSRLRSDSASISGNISVHDVALMKPNRPPPLKPPRKNKETSKSKENINESNTSLNVSANVSSSPPAKKIQPDEPLFVSREEMLGLPTEVNHYETIQHDNSNNDGDDEHEDDDEEPLYDEMRLPSEEENEESNSKASAITVNENANISMQNSFPSVKTQAIKSRQQQHGPKLTSALKMMFNSNMPSSSNVKPLPDSNVRDNRSLLSSNKSHIASNRHANVNELAYSSSSQSSSSLPSSLSQSRSSPATTTTREMIIIHKPVNDISIAHHVKVVDIKSNNPSYHNQNANLNHSKPSKDRDHKEIKVASGLTNCPTSSQDTQQLQLQYAKILNTQKTGNYPLSLVTPIQDHEYKNLPATIMDKKYKNNNSNNRSSAIVTTTTTTGAKPEHYLQNECEYARIQKRSTNSNNLSSL